MVKHYKSRAIIISERDQFSFSPFYLIRKAAVQLIIGWVISGLVPLFAVNIVYGPPVTQNQWMCLLGCMSASFLGYFSFRKLHVFPGLTSGGYIITAFSISYFILSFAFLMLRIDYSRMQIFLSYLLVNTFYIFIHVYFLSKNNLIFGVIRGGKADALPVVERVEWIDVEGTSEEWRMLNGVIADFNFDHDANAAHQISSFALSGIPVYSVSDVREQLTGQVEIYHLSENTLGSLNPSDFYIQIKGFADRLAAFILIICLAPVMLLVGLAIRIDSKGPAIFRQKRTGFRGVPFTVFKFRTMQVVQGESCDRLRAMTASNDPRITNIGRFLRKTRLDELPQLVNILLGDMSFIGPRPEALALSSWYETEIPFYNYRHIIKPGLTGWAQVNQGHVAEISDVHIKLHLDFYYVKYFSFWLDVLIVLKTMRTMVTGSGAK